MPKSAPAAARSAVQEPYPGSTVVAFRRRRPADKAVAGIAALVASTRRVPLERLLNRRRGEQRIAEARMLAMYLAHVALGRSYSEVGASFGRDRTTVSHACARMEDCRDDADFEQEVAALEAEIERLYGRAEPNRAAG